MKIKKFESFDVPSVDQEPSVDHIRDLKSGDIIMYHGSRCEVVEENETAVKVKSTQTGKEFSINQGQLIQYGVKLTD